MEELDIVHVGLLVLVIVFAINSLPKTVKEVLGSMWWVAGAIYLAGKFELVERLLEHYGVF